MASVRQHDVKACVQFFKSLLSITEESGKAKTKLQISPIKHQGSIPGADWD